MLVIYAHQQNHKLSKHPVGCHSTRQNNKSTIHASTNIHTNMHLSIRANDITRVCVCACQHNCSSMRQTNGQLSKQQHGWGVQNRQWQTCVHKWSERRGTDAQRQSNRQVSRETQKLAHANSNKNNNNRTLTTVAYFSYASCRCRWRSAPLPRGKCGLFDDLARAAIRTAFVIRAAPAVTIGNTGGCDRNQRRIQRIHA